MKMFDIKRKSNKKIIEEAINVYDNAIYNFIYKSLNFSEDAFDLLQETILKAIKYSKSYDKEKDIKSWLYKIAKNEINLYYKKKKRENIDNLYELDNLPQEKNINDDLKEIYDLIKSEKEEHRVIFYLYYEEGFKITEIAKMNDYSESNVKQILHRLREKIKIKLEVKK